jgi:hypothetical protein
MSIECVWWQTVLWGLAPASVSLSQGARPFFDLQSFERLAPVMVNIWANKRERMLFTKLQVKLPPLRTSHDTSCKHTCNTDSLGDIHPCWDSLDIVTVMFIRNHLNPDKCHMNWTFRYVFGVGLKWSDYNTRRVCRKYTKSDFQRLY